MKVANLDRDKFIVQKKSKKWTFDRLADFLNMSKSAVHKAYFRGLKKKKRLSTAKVNKVVAK